MGPPAGTGPLGGAGDVGAPLLGAPGGPSAACSVSGRAPPTDGEGREADSLGAVAVEVSSPSREDPAAAAAAGAAAAAASAAAAATSATAPGGSSPLESPLLSDAGAHIRSCFICLEGPRRGRGGAPPKLLHPCCTQCFAVVHEKCWTAYRRRQRLSSFRARLLGQRAPDTIRCSVCRTGRGGLPADVGTQGPPPAASDGASALQEELLASLSRLLIDEETTHNNAFCSGFCVCANTVLFILFFLVGGLLVAFSEMRGVTVFLLSLFLYYHFILFQLLFLALKQRRDALGLLPPSPQPPSQDPPSGGPPTGRHVAPAEEGGPPPSSHRYGGHQGAPPSPTGAPGWGAPLSEGPLEEGAPTGRGAPWTLEEGTELTTQHGWGAYGVALLSFFWRRGSRERGPSPDAVAVGGGPTVAIVGGPPTSDVGAPFLGGSSWAVEMRVLRSESLPA